MPNCCIRSGGNQEHFRWSSAKPLNAFCWSWYRCEAGRNCAIYIMVPCLGLTCDVIQSGEQGLPKAGLLVVVLSLILQNGDRGPEEEIWRAPATWSVCLEGALYLLGSPGSWG